MTINFPMMFKVQSRDPTIVIKKVEIIDKLS